MSKRLKLVGILTVATIAIGGAAWLSAQAGAVGEGKTVNVLASPT
jgi:hypothetical protein